MPRWVFAFPGVAFLVYLLALVLRLPALYPVAITWNSDAVTCELLAQSIAQGHAGAVFWGNSQAYTAPLIDIATAHLPAYRLIWGVWPAALFLGTIVLLCLLVWRIWDAHSALLVGLLSCALTLPLLFDFITQIYHGVTMLNALLLVIGLTWCVQQEARLQLPVIASAGILGVVTGINVASDELLLVIGIAPLFACVLVLLLAWHSRLTARMALLCGVLALAAALADRATIWIGSALHIVPHPLPFSLIAPSTLGSHLALTGAVVWLQVAGTWQVVASDVTAPADAALGVGALVLVGAGLIAALVATIRARTPLERTRSTYYLCWALIASADITAVTFTTATQDLWSVRYASILWLAAAATVPLLLVRIVQRVQPRREWIVAALASLVILVHAGLVFASSPTSAADFTDALPRVVTYLEQQHVTVGYADYWEANAATWATDGRVTLRPATSCQAAICGMELGNTSAWYGPEDGWSAIVVDPRFTLSVLPSAYGPPARVKRIGIMTVYLYNHPLDPPAIRPWP